MCCRCTLVKFIDEIMSWFDELSNETGLSESDLFENYNVSPGNQLPVVVTDREQPSLQLLQWGLIPRWHRDPDKRPPLFNARVETAHEKPSFRHLVQRHRGIAVCDGYYEWQKEGKKKVPYYIHFPDRAIMPLACLWDDYSLPSGQDLRTFTVMTCEPRKEIGDIHDRMPLILDRSFLKDWLNPQCEIDFAQPGQIVKADDALEFYTVSDFVNSTRNNSARCIEREDHYYTEDLFGDL